MARKIQQKQLESVAILSPAPTLTFVAGSAGTAANLTGVVFTLVKATAHELNYRCVFTWNAATTAAQVALALNNVSAAQITNISVNVTRASDKQNPDQVGAFFNGATPEIIFRNNLGGTLSGLVFISVAR